MPILRVTCGACGLSATQIRSGDRNVVSLAADECAVKCPLGHAAAAQGDNVVESVGACAHLAEALRAARERDAPPSR